MPQLAVQAFPQQRPLIRQSEGLQQRAAWGVTAGGWGSLRRRLGEERDQGEGKGGGRSLGPGLEQRLRQRQDLGPQLKGPWAGAGIGTYARAHISGHRSQSLRAQESLSSSQGSGLCRSSDRTFEELQRS